MIPKRIILFYDLQNENKNYIIYLLINFIFIILYIHLNFMNIKLPLSYELSFLIHLIKIKKINIKKLYIYQNNKYMKKYIL